MIESLAGDVATKWNQSWIRGGSMIDETLKRLLNAEMEAEQIVACADRERKLIIEQAKHEASTAVQQHAERIAEIRSSLLAQAEQRAQQSIATMQRRHDEQVLALRAASELNEQQALDEAIALLTGIDKQ
jgi:CMP-N-acetylneuraminic acid synthetase